MRLGLGRALALAALAWGAIAAAPGVARDRTIAPIANAEDFAAIAGGRWVLASSMAGGSHASGAIYAVEISSGKLHRIDPVVDAAPSTLTPDCPRPVPADSFKPHGIVLHDTADGETRLYVVNHGGRESIEIFALTAAPRPALRWIGCAALAKGLFGNSVALTPDGTLYMTNMGTPLAGGEAISPMGGDIVAWRPETGWRTVPDSAIEGPNGIVASADGKRLYVGSWPGSAIVELTLDGPATTRRTLAVDFLVDNLRWGASGALLATGHRASVAAVSDCYVSTSDDCPITSAMAEIDPAALTVSCERALPVGMATVALDVGHERWIGTARGRQILAMGTRCPAG